MKSPKPLNRIKVFFIPLLLLAVVSAQPLETDSGKEPASQSKNVIIAGEKEMNLEAISINVKDVPLNQVLTIISKKSGLTFIPDPDISGKLITLDLVDVDPLGILRIICQLYNLEYQELMEPGKYLVADHEAISIETKLYSYTCQFTQAKDLASILKNLVTPGVGNVYADDRTNTIIYRDSRTQVYELEHIIRSLDRPTRQIFIRSIIAELTLNKGDNRGLQWFTTDDKLAVGTSFQLRTNPGELSPVPMIAAGDGLGLGFLDANLDVAFNMITTVNDLNLLSSPYLITLDNQQAMIEVGDQIPYPKLNEFGVTSYEFKDATLVLKLNPHINNDSTITVKLQPQANYQQGWTPDGIPIIATRKADTQIVVETGKTVIIGGIMQESDVITESRVPFLGLLPFVGELFKSRKVSKQKTELIIMLSLEIVDHTFKEFSLDNNIIPETLKERINEEIDLH